MKRPKPINKKIVGHGRPYGKEDHIGVSRATFDNYVRKGLIPLGKKRLGFKEKSWNKQDLDNFIKNEY